MKDWTKLLSLIRRISALRLLIILYLHSESVFCSTSSFQSHLGIWRRVGEKMFSFSCPPHRVDHKMDPPKQDWRRWLCSAFPCNSEGRVTCAFTFCSPACVGSIWVSLTFLGQTVPWIDENQHTYCFFNLFGGNSWRSFKQCFCAHDLNSLTFHFSVQNVRIWW